MLLLQGTAAVLAQHSRLLEDWTGAEVTGCSKILCLQNSQLLLVFSVRCPSEAKDARKLSLISTQIQEINLRVQLPGKMRRD